MSLPYFVSTQETGFEMSMLKRFDLELLIGQLSYKQKADIYNVYEGYDTTKKTCSSTNKETSSHKTPVHRYVCQQVHAYTYIIICECKYVAYLNVGICTYALTSYVHTVHKP